MPKYDITDQEHAIIVEGLGQLLTSAQRQQNAKRGTPMIKEVYAKHESVLKQLIAKITAPAASK